jgi:nucleoid-associated protein
MSLEINQIALHQLIKRDEQTLEVVLRDSLLEPTATVVEMMAELHRVYSAKNKAYGLFSEESELADSLRLQRQGEEDFLAFSRAATGRLRDELAKYPFADGGIVLFCHYRYLAVEYLLVTVLNNLSSMRVNEQLDISSTHYLDINHADIVARIDLTEWETNPESTRYLTFLKGAWAAKWRISLWISSVPAKVLTPKRRTKGCSRRLTISRPKRSSINLSARRCASRFTATATNSCRRGRD